MKNFLLISIFLLSQIFFSKSHTNEKDTENQIKQTYSFNEVWAYVMRGEEKALRGKKAITDIAYFSARINEVGRIANFPTPKLILENFSKKAKIHCVVSAPGNRSLMYWCLKKDLSTRDLLIEDILKISKSFDGIQIDLETIRPEDRDAFFDFLREIKNKLSKDKIFSVAVPARTNKRQDAYDYAIISEIANRVLIMAYDEHWRTGSPGPIASLAWCKRVLNFASQNIDKDKLILGIPLYGRVWQKQTIAKALKYFQTLDLWKKYPSRVKREVDKTPYFEFQEKIDATVYFEDFNSLENKLSYYKSANLQGVGFWRISQEPASLWNLLKIEFHNDVH